MLSSIVARRSLTRLKLPNKIDISDASQFTWRQVARFARDNCSRTGKRSLPLSSFFILSISLSTFTGYTCFLSAVLARELFPRPSLTCLVSPIAHSAHNNRPQKVEPGTEKLRNPNYVVSKGDFQQVVGINRLRFPRRARSKEILRPSL